MQPRIYTYKITFEEVPYYYYGSKKEKVFDEEYWGSPVTNKWCWELYTPKKQILETFDHTDEGYIKAQEVEGRLIKPVYNTDKWCLNANCGGKICLNAIRKNKELGLGIFGLSSEKRSEIGKKSAQKAKENRTGIFALTKDQLIENAKKAGEKTKQNKTGIFGLSPEEKRKNSAKGGSIGGIKGGKTNKERQVGICGLSTEERKKYCSLGGKIVGNIHKQNKTGIFSLTEEQKIERSRKGGKSVSSQRWMCTQTGYISTAAGLSRYQKAKSIDTTHRVRVE